MIGSSQLDPAWRGLARAIRRALLAATLVACTTAEQVPPAGNGLEV